MAYQLSILSEDCVLVTFGNELDIDVNRNVIELHEHFRKNSYDYVIETAPAYTSLAIFLHVSQLQASGFTPLQYVQCIVEKNFTASQKANHTGRRILEIPVRYSGPDIEWVAAHCGLTVAQVIDIHSRMEYHVFMLGFQPGFPYMGITDKVLHVPRKSTPVHVLKGSVALAARQTGIYPQASPGGWQVIGYTEIPLVTEEINEAHFFINAGDTVKFIAI